MIVKSSYKINSIEYTIFKNKYIKKKTTADARYSMKTRTRTRHLLQFLMCVHTKLAKAASIQNVLSSKADKRTVPNPMLENGEALR